MISENISKITAIEEIIRNDNLQPLSENAVTSLDARAAELFIKAASESEKIQKGTLDALASGSLNPEQLMEIQQLVSSYNVNISLIGAIARKTVGAVETVLRS